MLDCEGHKRAAALLQLQCAQRTPPDSVRTSQCLSLCFALGMMHDAVEASSNVQSVSAVMLNTGLHPDSEIGAQLLAYIRKRHRSMLNKRHCMRQSIA